MTAVVAGTGSTANNTTQSNRCQSRTSSTEAVGKSSGGVKRSSVPPPSSPPKQQRLSISIKRAGLRNNQLEDSPVESDIVRHRSPKKLSSDSGFPVESSPSSKNRGRKKRRKRKTKTMELVPIIEPLHPLKVRIVERIKSSEYSSWSRPNGVELLVKAAELASRQNPTPPPEGDKLEVPNITKCPPPLLPISDPVISSNSDEGDSVNNNSKPTAPEEEIEVPKVIEQDSPQLTLVAEDDVEDEGKLMIVDEVNLNGSNGRDSGMDNDEEEEEDSAGALDLSSKSTRTSPPEESSNKSQREMSPKPASPQFVQQRSTALHSITDSLAQRQHQRLIQQQQQHHHRHYHQRRLPTPIHHPESMRNLVTLSQTASLVPPHPQQVATQRLIVASYMHQFAAAAAARAASAPLRPPKPPQPSLSLSHGLLRRPF